MADSQYYAACTLGLETVLSEELRLLGAQHLRSQRGGVQFSGDQRLGYAACLWLRSAVRVREVIGTGEAHDQRQFERLLSRIDWHRYLGVDQTLAVDASIRDSFLNHSLYAAQLVKDAIVDQFRRRLGRRPSVDTARPDLPLKLFLRGSSLTIYRDLSGASLHKRGYRPILVKSPLNEATAAGLILLTGWDRRSPVLDPMCGSATFAIEAAMIAGDRAPGLERKFAFQSWPDFAMRIWRDLIVAARARARSGIQAIPPIEAADHHRGAIGLARRAIEAADLQLCISLQMVEIESLQPTAQPALVLVNPPYGERLGELEQVAPSWRALGNFLRRLDGGFQAYVLCGHRELSSHLRWKASRRYAVRNGPIDCRWLQYSQQSPGDLSVKSIKQ